MKSHFSKLFGLLIGISLFAASCNTTNTNSQEPPRIPPAESMAVDISEMQSAEKQSAAKAVESNFGTALMATSLAKVVLQANLAIPRALVARAQNHSAEYEDGEWIWNYNSEVSGKSFGVRLVANTISEEEVTWNFYVTSPALNIEDKLFFSGTSDIEAESGTWTYYNLQTGEEISVLTWEHAENSASVNLEVTSDRNNRLGDTISYNFDGTTKTVEYFNSSDQETTTISFNTETLAGFIISPEYNNGEKSCWDSELNNVACS